MKSNVNHAFFNIGTNTTISVVKLAYIMIKASGLKVEPIYGPPLEGDVKITQADISSAKEGLGWKPTVKIEDWLDYVIKNSIIV
jgi:nucleoside-diphosphate-sugar epimerase